MIRRTVLLATLSFLLGCAGHQAPPQDISQRTALKGSLPYPILDWKVLTTVADRGQKTMSTLFGNDAATAAARANKPYPAGSVIALATWHEWDNPHWFGSRVPGDPQRVEFVEFTPEGTHYRSFGEPLFQEQSNPEPATRIVAITAMKAVPLP